MKCLIIPNVMEDIIMAYFDKLNRFWQCLWVYFCLGLSHKKLQVACTGRGAGVQDLPLDDADVERGKYAYYLRKVLVSMLSTKGLSNR